MGVAKRRIPLYIKMEMSRNDLKDPVSVPLCSAESLYGTARCPAIVGSNSSSRSSRSPLQLGHGTGWQNMKILSELIRILKILNSRFRSLIFKKSIKMANLIKIPFAHTQPHSGGGAAL